MNQVTDEITFRTSCDGFIDITESLNVWVKNNKIQKGILLVFLKHTSCSLTINENADSRVLEDLYCYLNSIVPEEQYCSLDNKRSPNKYLHSEEGVDDMPAHIKTMLTNTNLTLSIISNKISLGTWQAIYLWEHRYQGSERKLILHAIGDLF